MKTTNSKIRIITLMTLFCMLSYHYSFAQKFIYKLPMQTYKPPMQTYKPPIQTYKPVLFDRPSIGIPTPNVTNKPFPHTIDKPSDGIPPPSTGIFPPHSDTTKHKRDTIKFSSLIKK